MTQQTIRQRLLAAIVVPIVAFGVVACADEVTGDGQPASAVPGSTSPQATSSMADESTDPSTDGESTDAESSSTDSSRSDSGSSDTGTTDTLSSLEASDSAAPGDSETVTTTATASATKPDMSVTKLSPPPAPMKPAAVGQLPVAVGQWHLLSDGELRKGIANGNGMDDAITPIGGNVADKTPLPTQLGVYQVNTQRKLLRSTTDIELSATRTFGVHRVSEYLDGSVSQLLLVTSLQVTGPQAGQFLELRKQDFAKDATKEAGKLVKTGRVWCDVGPGARVRGCIVFGAAGWIETELIGGDEMTTAESADQIKSLAAVAPR